MSDIVAVERVLGAEIPAGDLDALCKAVRKRAAWDVYCQHDDREHIFRAVGDRLHRTRNGQTMAGAIVRTEADLIRLHEEFEADLRGLLALPVDRFVQCVQAGATNPNGFNAYHAVDALRQIRLQQTSPALPRVQPRELLARLASAGVLVQAFDGNLHVQPAELLSEADRAALTVNKAAILEALVRPAEVI